MLAGPSGAKPEAPLWPCVCPLHSQPVAASGGPAPSVSYSDGRVASGPPGIEPISYRSYAGCGQALAVAGVAPSRSAPPGPTLAAAFSPSMPCRLFFSLPEVHASAAGTAVGDAETRVAVARRVPSTPTEH